jgi:hypothetical protein
VQVPGALIHATLKALDFSLTVGYAEVYYWKKRFNPPRRRRLLLLNFQIDSVFVAGALKGSIMGKHKLIINS